MGTEIGPYHTAVTGPSEIFGGARRDRTADLLHAMQALSQLSYSPTKAGTLRGGQNPVKALSSSYYAFEIIGLASPVRSESCTELPSGFTRPRHKPSRSICAIPPFTQPQLRSAIPGVLAS